MALSRRNFKRWMRQFIDDEAEWNGTSAGELPITFEVDLLSEQNLRDRMYASLIGTSLVGNEAFPWEDKDWCIL